MGPAQLYHLINDPAFKEPENMVHGTHAHVATNERFALVSTVDSMGPEFPSHCVMVFDTEEDALAKACNLIVQHCETACGGGGVWTLDGENYDSKWDFIDAFQGKLDITEYFHIMPIQPCLT